ncbi:MAG TPA: hypothetical protein PK919_11285 [Candidatus Aminicenantes bacterium]|nr:hypothetical protein [Candidatus Aminicenantes bacterium]
MDLVEIRELEDCFDGGSKLEYRFSAAIGDEFMRRMAAGSRLDFFPEFPRPFFKIFHGNGIQVKGVLGDSCVEVYFPRADMKKIRRQFEEEIGRLLPKRS